MPLGAQGLHRVGVTVEVDDLLVLRWHAIERVAHDPDEVAVVVEPHVVGVAHGLDVDDRVAQEVKPATLVVREPRTWVTAVVDGSVDLVGRDADGLLQDCDGERAIPLGQFGRPCGRASTVRVLLTHWTFQTPPLSTAARSGTFAAASRAMTTYTFLFASRATATRNRSITPGLTSAPMSAGRQCR